MLDLFCGAGGCAVGYHRAGFNEIVGVDNRPQPNYPFEFIQADALEYITEHGEEFDFIHASPPCQAYSVMRSVHKSKSYPKLLAATRRLLRGHTYVIENVVGAPMICPIKLCGAMFGLKVYRHRFFESSVILFEMFHPRHKTACAVQGRPPKDGQFMTVTGHFSGAEYARTAMGINWMTRDELSQAIPPAYTEFIGKQILATLSNKE